MPVLEESHLDDFGRTYSLHFLSVRDVFIDVSSYLNPAHKVYVDCQFKITYIVIYYNGHTLYFNLQKQHRS